MFRSRNFALTLFFLGILFFGSAALAQQGPQTPLGVTKPSGVTGAHVDSDNNVVLEQANGATTVFKPDGPPTVQPKTERQPDGTVIGGGTQITSYGGGTVTVIDPTHAISKGDGITVTVKQGEGQSTTFTPGGIVIQRTEKDGVITEKNYSKGNPLVNPDAKPFLITTIDKDKGVRVDEYPSGGVKFTYDLKNMNKPPKEENFPIPQANLSPLKNEPASAAKGKSDDDLLDEGLPPPNLPAPKAAPAPKPKSTSGTSTSMIDGEKIVISKDPVTGNTAIKKLEPYYNQDGSIKEYKITEYKLKDKDGNEIPCTLDKDGNVVPVYFDLQPQFKGLDKNKRPEDNRRNDDELLEGD